MIVDAFNHILPAPFLERLQREAPNAPGVGLLPRIRTLWDLDAHLRLMDEFASEGYRQILTLCNPPIEYLGPPDKTPDWARFANDLMADICRRHKDKFPGFAAALPMNNPDAAVIEAERAIRDLGACGIEVYTNVLGRPISAPEFVPLFEAAARHDLPVWIHPMRGPGTPDFAGESQSVAEIWFTFGWPYETSAAVTRLIYAGLFDRLPNLKIITHHGGGMIPFFSGKVDLGTLQIMQGTLESNPLKEQFGLARQPADYFRLLYADTATIGAAHAVACSHAFFGTANMVFATDAPFDPTGGAWVVRKTIDAVKALPIGEAERRQILSGNIMRLTRLV